MIPFKYGKYKNNSIEDIPTHYLLWCIENNTTITENTLFFIKIEILKRFDLISTYDINKLNHSYKKMAIKYHPDRGGSHKEMLVVNEFYNLLK